MRSRTKVMSLLATLFFLMLLVPPTGATTVNDVNSLIDPAIQGEERAVVAELMRSLEPQYRENVIYINAAGDIFANRPELKKAVNKWELVMDNLYRDPEGNICAFPDDTQIPDGYGISKTEISDASILAAQGGAYRRVKSKNSYSYMECKVHLAGGAEIYEAMSTDTAYTYVGGTGSTGVEVDAGCQHSPTYDNWAWYMKVSGTPYTYTPRFKSKQDVTLRFWVPQAGKVSLAVSGYDVNGTYRTMTYVHDAAGWTTNGGNAMKKVTSIAQNGGDNFKSGSYHTNVHWYNSKIGTSTSSYHTWSANDMATTGGYTSYPNQTHVIVNPYVSASEETVHIRLDL